MDQQTMQMAIDFLDKLGEKIGVAGGQIWPWFVRQQYVDAVTSAIRFIVFFVVVAAVAVYTFRNWESMKDNDAGPTFVIALILGAIFVSVTFIWLMIDFGAFFNPEYYALEDLLRQIQR